MRIELIIAFVAIAALCTHCRYISSEPAEDKVLAKVHNKTLLLSELEGLFPEGTTGADSQLVISAYTDRWIREALLLYEAEQNIPTDLNIDKLVRDYRASLIKNNYEQVLVHEMLDSVVTDEELRGFYKEHLEQYQLDQAILRCYLIKLPLDAPNTGQLKKWWESSNPRDFAEMVQYANQYALVHLLEDSVWYESDKISLQLPPNAINIDDLGEKRSLQTRDGRFQYYYKLLEWRNPKSVAPLAYVEDQIKKMILYRRKQKLLDDTKEELYNREMRRNNIQVFTQ